MRMIDIPMTERGVIRVFAISRPMAQMARALERRAKADIAAELLAHPVPEDTIELFALSDLTGVGLPGYLTDGYAVDATAVRADRARLEALDGYVLLLHSSVARNGTVTLTPSTDLTLIGTYAEPRPSRAAAPIATQAAKPYSGAHETPQPPKRSRLGSMLSGIIVLTILLLLWWIL